MIKVTTMLDGETVELWMGYTGFYWSDATGDGERGDVEGRCGDRWDLWVEVGCRDCEMAGRHRRRALVDFACVVGSESGNKISRKTCNADVEINGHPYRCAAPLLPMRTLTLDDPATAAKSAAMARGARATDKTLSALRALLKAFEA